MRSISALVHDMHVSTAQFVCVGLSSGISALPGPWPKGFRTKVKNSLSAFIFPIVYKAAVFLAAQVFDVVVRPFLAAVRPTPLV
jgi:hypothetical protein